MSTAFIKPMECLSAKKLPRGERWTYEIKQTATASLS